MSVELTVTIPNNVKLSLSNGALVLLRDSTYFVPNGIGVIERITTTEAFLCESAKHNTKELVVTDGFNIDLVPVDYFYVGRNEPTGQHALLWFDTLNNVIKYAPNGSSCQETPYSFPLGLVTTNSNSILSLDETYNGFVTINDMLYVMPDVEGLVPNGFDYEGNASFKTCTTKTILMAQKQGNYPYLRSYEDTFNEIYFASSDDVYRGMSNLFFDNEKVLSLPFGNTTTSIEPSTLYTTRLIGQYANSPVMLKLANGLGTLFDESGFIANWYNVVFNLETATGYGLDVWGLILNRSREFVYQGTKYYLQGAQTIGSVTFTAEQMENLYRKILQLTAMRYIGNASLASLNSLIQFVFKEDGECYCLEYEAAMHIRYVFRFYLNDVQKAVIETIDPHPSGVTTSYEYLPVGTYFGFIVRHQEEQPYLPFDNGPFYR